MVKTSSSGTHDEASRFEALVRLVGGRGTVAERNRALRLIRSRYGDRLSQSTLAEIERLSSTSTTPNKSSSS